MKKVSGQQSVIGCQNTWKFHMHFSELSNIPEGYEVPKEEKPWGTAHAVLSCIDQIDGPFAVINADDYYGVEAFRLIYDFEVEVIGSK